MDENGRIAASLREVAALLEAQGASPFRVHAYRDAAQVVAGLGRPVRELFDAQGREGLDALPHIGSGISSAIAEMLITGGWRQLQRLRGEAAPEVLKRVARESAARPSVPPPVELLLEIDREYREKAAAGRLVLIAPKRFNPEGKAWLPVLHAHRGEWHFTALFSNTARAHELHRTRDWVVIYYYDREHREGQCTVVTQARGPLAGARVVRGREDECRRSAA